ncbi:MAG: hypothetical protein V4557_12840 [Bacteroidota bacterium]
MSSRRARQLPIIEIGGTKFYFDLRLWQFRDVDNWANQFQVDDLFETARGFKLCFDTAKKNLFVGTAEEFKANKDAIIVTLPSIKKMDPLGHLWWEEELGCLSADEAKKRTEEMLNDYEVHESGMILQRKPEKISLLPKRERALTNKKGKRL